MKWIDKVLIFLEKFKHVIKFVLAIEAAIDAFGKVIKSEEPKSVESEK